jgi:uncharacterized coiled-coil DUF342 family protein
MDKGISDIVETLNIILAKMATKDDLEALRAEMHEEFVSVRSDIREIRDEVREIRTRLDAIEVELKDHRGYAIEIDHLLHRVSAIEKQLGIQDKVVA